MPVDRFDQALQRRLDELEAAGTHKRVEPVVTGVVAAAGARGPRYRLAGEGARTFIRMNSNGYLGMALQPAVRDADERAVREYGAGPQAVRFISGTYAPHVELEQRLAAFHGRPAAMVLSSAYATVMSVLAAITTPDTAIISDELNHSCIINGIRLAQPKLRLVYRHLDLAHLADQLEEAGGTSPRAVVVTDGVFSMRGDHAQLDRIAALCAQADEHFPENVVLMVDDSHGAGAFGATGRGTEEVTGARSDVLVATLGKAFGVNGGYVVGSATLIDYLRETAPMYVYSNSITAGEAAAALAAIDLLDGPVGRDLLTHLRAMTTRFRRGLVELGFETIEGAHPVVPLLARDTARTRELVSHLRAGGVLATGLGYPVVPRGEDEVRFQVTADHTEADIDEVLAVLESFAARP